ncbi:MAG: cyclic pyranopterin monophosphate synthase MoaC [Syntrophomonadaceae bacterium]|nr:cyclic pyranopterin monophosphate synthase MoaC [Syntrophomonadaceae bacterium]
MEFTHINDEGRAHMVDVSGKADTQRMARAEATVWMKPETLSAIREGAVKKGDVLAVAQVAGIMAAKHTPGLIPMCHPLMLTKADISFSFDEANSALRLESLVKCTGATGVEMEAITAVTVAALTVYDMVKAVDRFIRIGDIGLLEKDGGKSGHIFRD